MAGISVKSIVGASYYRMYLELIMNLYMGKMLIVDLTTTTVSAEPLRLDWAAGKDWGSRAGNRKSETERPFFRRKRNVL